MALIQCPNCFRETSDGVPDCIVCGKPLTKPAAKKYNPVVLVCVLIPIVVAIYFTADHMGLLADKPGGGMEKVLDSVTATPESIDKKIKNQVVEDCLKQYEIAKRSGTARDAYVHAGLVAAAYLQAHDEVNYKVWKEIERKDGLLAGIR